MDPDSNQQSKTSGTRRNGGLPGCFEGIVKLSILEKKHRQKNALPSIYSEIFNQALEDE